MYMFRERERDRTLGQNRALHHEILGSLSFTCGCLNISWTFMDSILYLGWFTFSALHYIIHINTVMEWSKSFIVRQTCQ